MPTKPSTVLVKRSRSPKVFERIRRILETSQEHIARTVNSTQVMANWLIGREIIEEEQKGKARADYGDGLLIDLSNKMLGVFGRGWSVRQLEYCRRFYLAYPILLSAENSNALRSNSPKIKKAGEKKISNAVRSKSQESWQVGQLHVNLSWTHYRALLKITRSEARSFYELEAVNNTWSARELERQISSLLYDRLLKSRAKSEIMRLALKGQEIIKPLDMLKDPLVLEFVNLPVSHKLVESDLEQALINNLQHFLLELGKGFAFISRQERISLDGDHFYIDLVFYHTILKCHILIDLKVGKLSHADLGQIQFYVNYYDREKRTTGDGPTIGLILCSDKNDAVVRYTFGEQQKKNIFTSRYQLHLPTEEELASELKREFRLFIPNKPPAKAAEKPAAKTIKKKAKTANKAKPRKT